MIVDMGYKGTVVITNASKIVSGDIRKGILDADTIVVRKGIVDQVGRAASMDTSQCDHIVDVHGQVICPGWIDAHVHNGIEDYKASSSAIRWMEGYLWYGITTLVSEGEHGPGHPRYVDDPIGTKAMAIVARRVFENYRPGGLLKVHGGALVLVPGLTEADFDEMARAGVWLIAEIGGGGLYKPEDVLPMIAWARKRDFRISVHVGPQSIPGSSVVGADIALAIRPDKFAHMNGGSTAASWEDIRRIIDEGEGAIELVTMGNQKMAGRIYDYLSERDELHRVVYGSDTPTGQGTMPNCIQRMVMRAAAFHDIPPAQAIAMGTGNTADLYGLNTGKIEVGREADILVIDSAENAQGEDALEAMTLDDTFGVSMVMVDGQICSVKGRDGRPTRRHVSIDGVPTFIDNITEHSLGPCHPGYLR